MSPSFSFLLFRARFVQTRIYETVCRIFVYITTAILVRPELYMLIRIRNIRPNGFFLTLSVVFVHDLSMIRTEERRGREKGGRAYRIDSSSIDRDLISCAGKTCKSNETEARTPIIVCHGGG